MGKVRFAFENHPRISHSPGESTFRRKFNVQHADAITLIDCPSNKLAVINFVRGAIFYLFIPCEYVLASSRSVSILKK